MPLKRLHEELVSIIVKNTGWAKKNVEKIKIAIPPKNIEYDYCFSVFLLATLLKKTPDKVATSIQKILDNNPIRYVKRIVRIGSYINIKIDSEQFIKEILKKILKKQIPHRIEKKEMRQTLLINCDVSNISQLSFLRLIIIAHALVKLYQQKNQNIVSYIFNDLNQHNVTFNQYGKIKTKNSSRQLRYDNSNLFNMQKNWIDLFYKNLKTTFRINGINLNFKITKNNFKFERQTIKDLQLKKLCHHYPQTNVILTHSSSDRLPILLQREDGSHTALLRYLSDLKKKNQKYQLNHVVYITTIERIILLEQLNYFGIKMRYLSKKTKVDPITIGHISAPILSSPTKEFLKNETEELEKLIQLMLKKQSSHNSQNTNLIFSILQYHILREPPKKSIEISSLEKITNQNQNNLLHILTLIYKLKRNLSLEKTHLNRSSQKNLLLVKKLIDFESIKLKALQTNNPSIICSYIEHLTQYINGLLDNKQELENSILFAIFTIFDKAFTLIGLPNSHSLTKNKEYDFK